MSPTFEATSTISINAMMCAVAGSTIVAWGLHSPKAADSTIEQYRYTIVMLYAYARIITHSLLMKKLIKHSPTLRSTGEFKSQDLVFFVGDFIFAFFWLPFVCFVFYGAFWKENEMLWTDHPNLLKCFFCAYLVDRAIHLIMGGGLKMQRLSHHSLVALTVLLGLEILPDDARDIAFMMVGQQEMFVRFAWPGYILQQLIRQAIRNQHTPTEDGKSPKCLQDLELDGIDAVLIPKTPEAATRIGRFAFLVHVISHYINSPGLSLLYLAKFHSGMHWFWIIALPVVVMAFSVIAIPQVQYFLSLSNLEYWTTEIFLNDPPRNAYFGVDKLPATAGAADEHQSDTDSASSSISVTEKDTSESSTYIFDETNSEDTEDFEVASVLTKLSFNQCTTPKEAQQHPPSWSWPMSFLIPKKASPLAITYDDILATTQVIKGSVKRTSCEKSQSVSSIVGGANVFLKKEFQQHTKSFKERGAHNAIVKALAESGLGGPPGVIAASTGNHALALAYHGKKLRVPVIVVVPHGTPITKVDKCKTLFGATIIMKGKNINEAEKYAQTLVESKGFVYINGYDDPAVLAGAGTIGIEIMEDVKDVDMVIVPVGGAGQIAGISCAIKAINPNVKVIGVEPHFCPSYTAALKAGKPVPVNLKPTLADGLGVPQVGPRAFDIARRFVDECVLVEEKQIMKSIQCLVENENIVVEGGGAIALASLLPGGPLFDRPEITMKGKNIVVIMSGGNIDTSVLQAVLDPNRNLVDLDEVPTDVGVGVAAANVIVDPDRDMSVSIGKRSRRLIGTSLFRKMKN